MTIHVAALGYTVLKVQDVAEWQRFATEVLGLMPAEQSADGERATFRMDDHPFRICVEKADQNKLAYVGWEMADQQDYQTAIENLTHAGAPITPGDAPGAKMRCVTQYVASADPDGNAFELYYGRTHLTDDFKSPAGVKQFLTSEMGMGHLVIPTKDIDATHSFYKETLGFLDSDNLTLPPPQEGLPEQHIVFLHAANPRHHSLGLYNYPIPTGIAHLMLEVPDIDHVGTCLDRVKAADIPLMSTLGRHHNDQMLSFYMVAPGGIGIEYGCEGLQIDPHQFKPTLSTQADIWGHIYYFHDSA